MVPVFYTLIRYRNFLKIEMVLFFSIFNRSDSPQKALSNTLETVSAEVQFGFFFGSFLCKSMERQNLSIGGSYRGGFRMPRRGAKNEPLFFQPRDSCRETLNASLRSSCLIQRAICSNTLCHILHSPFSDSNQNMED